jgi:hypothetical protein
LKLLVPRSDGANQEQARFVVEIARKALELSSQTQDQRVVQFVGHPSAASSASTKRFVSRPKTVNSVSTDRSPRR